MPDDNEKQRPQRSTLLATVGVGLLIILSVYSIVVGRGFTVVLVGWAAFLAMSIGLYLGSRSTSQNPFRLVWGYGFAGGAMITSAAIFLVPQAIGYAPHIGGAGIALGLGTGYAGHVIGHRLSHLDLPLDQTTAQITAHAIAAGLVTGVVYASDPRLGPVLGLAIASHKGPAGYAAARRLRLSDRSIRPLFLPASALGVAALLARLSEFSPPPTTEAALFGFATGIFLHLGMDFLPSCEVGGEIHNLAVTNAQAHDHELLDILRLHAVVSLAFGGIVVFSAWLLL